MYIVRIEGDNVQQTESEYQTFKRENAEFCIRNPMTFQGRISNK